MFILFSAVCSKYTSQSSLLLPHSGNKFNTQRQQDMRWVFPHIRPCVSWYMCKFIVSGIPEAWHHEYRGSESLPEGVELVQSGSQEVQGFAFWVGETVSLPWWVEFLFDLTLFLQLFSVCLFSFKQRLLYDAETQGILLWNKVKCQLDATR